MKEIEYIAFTCRNKKCGGVFQDIDFYNSSNFPPTFKYCKTCVEKGFKNPKFIRFTVPESLREKEFDGIEIDYFILLVNEKLQYAPKFKSYATKLMKQSLKYLERDILKGKQVSKLNYDACFKMAVEKINYIINQPPEALPRAG